MKRDTHDHHELSARRPLPCCRFALQSPNCFVYKFTSIRSQYIQILYEFHNSWMKYQQSLLRSFSSNEAHLRRPSLWAQAFQYLTTFTWLDSANDTTLREIRRDDFEYKWAKSVPVRSGLVEKDVFSSCKQQHFSSRNSRQGNLGLRKMWSRQWCIRMNMFTDGWPKTGTVELTARIFAKFGSYKSSWIRAIDEEPTLTWIFAFLTKCL